MRIISLFTILIFALVACSPNEPSIETPPTPTERPLIGTVQIDAPQSDAVIDTEVLLVQGSIADVESFRLTIITSTGQQLFDGHIGANAGNWQREIVHNYHGEPVEATITARATDRHIHQAYDELSVTIGTVNS
jgi:hypothetical protein